MCRVRARISLATAIFAVLAIAGSIVSIEGHAARAKPRPNVVVIETDDQTLEEMRVMRNTLALIGRQGTTFDSNFVTLSLCCPSRATFLTGQYAHNNGVLTNAMPNGGYREARPHEHARRLAAEGRLQHGARRQVPERLQARRRHPAGLDGMACRREPRLLQLDDERAGHARPLRLAAAGLPDERALAEGRRGDRPPRARVEAAVHVGHLPRAARRRAEGAGRPQGDRHRQHRAVP